jgi:glycosyltransferase involved in cell wall biosynthesis
MKFSVLIPTRNRLELLRYAIETVLRQDYPDWEIIVADNDSEQDVAGYVRSLAEPRIRYFRSDRFLPVTDNWNAALEKSEGDFIVMLGDDDCLMKRYFSTLLGIMKTHGRPDFVYHSALLYAYPGVMPGFAGGYLHPYGYAEFLRSAKEPFWLGRRQARALVRDAMDFRVSYGFNMQFALIGRPLVDALSRKGPFFQSPYPDYYAMNAMLLNAERMLVCPYPLVTIGISQKSFGFYYFNRAERKGTEFLNNACDAETATRMQGIVLPGTDMNTCWLLAMECLKLNYGADAGLAVNYDRYRLLQILQVATSIDGEPTEKLREILPRLKFPEKCIALTVRMITAAASWLPMRFRRILADRLLALARSHLPYAPQRITGRYRNILEVYDDVDPMSARLLAEESGR